MVGCCSLLRGSAGLCTADCSLQSDSMGEILGCFENITDVMSPNPSITTAATAEKTGGHVREQCPQRHNHEIWYVCHAAISSCLGVLA